MTTYYCIIVEETMRKAKLASKQPGRFFDGIVLYSGMKRFAIYCDGRVVEQYSVISSLI